MKSVAKDVAEDVSEDVPQDMAQDFASRARAARALLELPLLLRAPCASLRLRRRRLVHCYRRHRRGFLGRRRWRLRGVRCGASAHPGCFCPATRAATRARRFRNAIRAAAIAAVREAPELDATPVLTRCADAWLRASNEAPRLQIVDCRTGNNIVLF